MQLFPQAAQAQDVNKLYSIVILLRNVRFIEIVWEIYFYANLKLCLNKATNVQIKVTYFKV